MPSLSLSLLGPFQAVLDGRPVTGLESNKVRALLAYLAVEADRPHSRDELIGLLWPDQPDAAARANLRQALANLRNAIGDRTSEAPFLAATFDSVQFQCSKNCAIDILTFTGLITACQTHVHRRLETCRSCAQRLQQAAELYRGDFLAQFVQSGSEAFEEWTLIQRERLHREVLDALYILAEYHDRRGDHDHVRQYAQRQLELDPWREEAHRQLMRGLALSGQRSAALSQFETCRRVLAHQLNAEPSQETVTLHARIKADQLTHAEQRHNLPNSLTSLVGRKRELVEIDRLLGMPACRLLTLTGPGGVGKTRLALQSAADHIGLFANGVWLIELASLSDPALILQSVAATLGLREHGSRSLRDTLIDFLRSREVLLVLDNCEHLIEASARTADDLLRTCPQLSILCTSREVLRIAGEVVLRVPPLTAPDPRHLPAHTALTGFEAVQLFVERAEAAALDFAVTEDNGPVVAQICHQLDGMPLAIELAAACIRTFSTEQIAARLDDRFRLLTDGYRTALLRHQTLRATIDWSYELLPVTERTLLRRLAVFVGGWTLEAARTVCADSSGPGGLVPETIPALLAQLANKSLIGVERKDIGHLRYHILETIRQYAHEKLLEANEEKTIRQQHLIYFLQFAQTDDPEPESDREKPWRDELEIEIDNLRAAMHWSLANSVELGLSLAGIVGRVMWPSLYASEGLDWLRKFLIQSDAPLSRTLARARALHWAGVLKRGLSWGDRADTQSSLEQSRVWLEESLTDYQELEYSVGSADALFELGWVAQYQGDWETARRLYSKSVKTSQEAGDKIRAARALNRLGEVAFTVGDRARARQYHIDALQIYRDLGCRYAAKSPLGDLGEIALWEGDLVAARSYAEESLALFRESNDERNGGWVLFMLSEVLVRQEQFDEARATIERKMELHEEEGHGLGLDFLLLAFLACAQGEYSRADAFYRQSLEQARHTRFYFPFAIEGLASVAALQGEARRAITLYGAAAGLRAAFGTPPAPVYQADNERGIATARALLDKATFLAAWESGQKMTPEQVIAFAMSESDKA